MGWTVRRLYDDTGCKSPDFEMDLLNFLDLQCGTLKRGKGGSLSMNDCHKGAKTQRDFIFFKLWCPGVLVAIFIGVPHDAAPSP
jgi:hypothetical protein